MADVAQLGLTVDATGAVRALDQFEGAAKKATKEGEGLAATLGGKLKTAIGGIAVMGTLTAMLRKTIDETAAAQAAQAQLAAALASTGGAAGRSLAELNDFAGAMQDVTTYGDDAVTAMQSVLLTFTKISGPIFDRAQWAIADIATRLGGDLQGAAIQVGKALNDPIAGVTALTKVGVSFTDGQKEMIKQLVETGRVADAQILILRELETEFGGSAKAARDTLGGALAALNNAWGDLFEVSRGASQGSVSAINAITDALSASGLSMNSILTDAAVDWETMLASIRKVHAVMSLPLDANFLKAAQNVIDRINYDLAMKIAELRKEAEPGPTTSGTAPGGDTGTGLSDAARKAAEEALRARQANEDRVREAEQALTLAGLTSEEAEKLRAIYAAQNAEIEAQRRLKGEILDETRAAIAKEREITLETIDRAREAKKAQEAERIAREHIADMAGNIAEKTASAFTEGMRGWLAPFRGIVDQLLRSFITRFIQPALSAMMGLDVTKTMSLNDIGNATVNATPGGGMQMLGAGVGGALVGYQVGGALYSASHGSAGNYARGAIGGALSGAATGAMIAGPIGAVVGGLAGLTGGLLGAGKAAREAAKAMGEMQKNVRLSLDAALADARGDTRAAAMARILADTEAYRKQVEEAFKGGSANSEQVRMRNIELARVAELERLRIANLDKEAAALQGVADASSRLTTSLLNVPSGFRVAAAVFNATQLTGMGPTGPLVRPPSTPRPGLPGAPTTKTLIVPVNVNGREIARVVVKDLEGRAQAQYGDTTRWGEVAVE